MDTEHRRSAKSSMRGIAAAQQRRREQALIRQQQARRDFTLHAREVATDSVAEDHMSDEKPLDADFPEQVLDERTSQDEAMCMDVGTSRSRSSRDKHAKKRQSSSRSFYLNQLMTPEWMVDIPADLASNWYVVCHPEGDRCLIVVASGGTISRRRKDGSILHRFPSNLPNGSKASQTNSSEYSILDAVFHPGTSSYYVLDVMCWNGHAVYDCTREFRVFWLLSKLQETQAHLPAGPLHRFPFHPLASYECTPEGLKAAYSDPVPYIRGGLMFYNKEGHYTLGSSPLMLHWKDQHCSAYVIDTDKDGNVLPQQSVVLKYDSGTQNLVTGDEHPVALATMPGEFVQTNMAKLRDGLLMKCVVGERGICLDPQGRVTVADVHLEGVANQRRAGADSFTKVLFQYAARHQPLTFQHILDAVGMQPR